ncbi:MAG: peptidoglycan-binding protein [Pseudolabrys sp.]
MGRRHGPASWAGVMGQTQFMPSNYVDYAIDASGDGRIDIWRNVPDVLGSTANYLHKGHWRRGLPWGFEVRVPKGFDYRVSRDSFAGWLKRGDEPIDGKTLPHEGRGILLFPASAKGPADDHQLSRPARIALQKKRVALGYKVNDFDGHIDFDLRDNIRCQQVKFGMVPDGNPTRRLLDRLGVKVP